MLNDLWKLKYDLREWQKTAFEKWNIEKKGIISVVTGGGKTVFAFFCIKKIVEQSPDKKFLIIVPTLTLLDQWYISLQDELNVKPEDIALFSGEEKPKTFKTINVIVINTARVMLPKIPDKETFVLIVDECHRTGSPTNGKAIEGNYFSTLGLSATPEREYDDGFSKYMKPNLGEIVFKYDYRSALRDGVICRYELINVQVDLLEHESLKYDSLTKKIILLKKKGDESDPLTKQKINLLLIKRARIAGNALMRLPVAAKIADEFPLQRIIIFHESIDAANTIYKTLLDRNKNATIYHSKIGSMLRRDNLRLYRNGTYNILVTCKALDEGMNAPETTLAVIASSTSSTRQRIQRLGRVLRPAVGKDKAVIYTLYSTDQEKKRLTSEFHEISDEVNIKWLKSSSTYGKNIS